MTNRSWSLRAFLIASALALANGAALAQGQGDQKQFSSLMLSVGSEPGGGYDLLARLLAKHLPRFLSGHPNVIVQNMPGQGSLLLANRTYNTAQKDGTFIAMVQRGVLLSGLSAQADVRFDLTKFNWIGNVTSEDSLVAVWHKSTAMTFRDLMQRPYIFGGTGKTSDSEAAARLLNGVAGTKIEIVSGYPANINVLQAMETGEVDGTADISWSNLKSVNAALLKNGNLRLLAQHGEQKLPALPDVPPTFDFIKSAEDQEVARLYYSVKSMARPIFAPPGVPAQIVAQIRAAFWSTVHDPEFLSDAKQQKLELNPSQHTGIESFLAEVESAPRSVRERLRKIIIP